MSGQPFRPGGKADLVAALDAAMAALDRNDDLYEPPTLLVTPKQWAYADEQAKAAGMNVQDWIRSNTAFYSMAIIQGRTLL